MAKPSLHTFSALKIRAILDDALDGILGRRIFTSVVTDDSLRAAIKRARLASGHKGVLSKSVARKAAAAREALHS